MIDDPKVSAPPVCEEPKASTTISFVGGVCK